MTSLQKKKQEVCNFVMVIYSTNEIILVRNKGTKLCPFEIVAAYQIVVTGKVALLTY